MSAFSDFVWRSTPVEVKEAAARPVEYGAALSLNRLSVSIERGSWQAGKARDLQGVEVSIGFVATMPTFLGCDVDATGIEGVFW
jgi:hypothetical protein